MYLEKLWEQKDRFKHSLVSYKKAYDMFPHSLIIATMGMVGLAGNILDRIEQSINKWKTNLYADGKILGSVSIWRGIFQGDLLSPIPFVIALLPLTHLIY